MKLNLFFLTMLSVSFSSIFSMDDLWVVNNGWSGEPMEIGSIIEIEVKNPMDDIDAYFEAKNFDEATMKASLIKGIKEVRKSKSKKRAPFPKKPSNAKKSINVSLPEDEANALLLYGLKRCSSIGEKQEFSDLPLLLEDACEKINAQFSALSISDD